MKTKCTRIVTAVFLLSLLAQPLLADRISVGNPRKQCRGMGFCTGTDPRIACPSDFDADFDVEDGGIIVTFHNLPARLRDEISFGTNDYTIVNPQRFGYRSITILAGQYAFDWTREQVVLPFRGERDTGTLFSDLSKIGNAYQSSKGWRVSGSNTEGNNSFTVANQFQPVNSGTVSQIGVAVSYVSGVNSFYVALYTDAGGMPGTQIGSWDNLSSGTNSGGCCGLISITGISGVTLTTGQDYWIVVGPSSTGSTTWGTWNLNLVGTKGMSLYSNDGGNTWNSSGQQTLGAFDILGN